MPDHDPDGFELTPPVYRHRLSKHAKAAQDAQRQPRLFPGGETLGRRYVHIPDNVRPEDLASLMTPEGVFQDDYIQLAISDAERDD